ncbi:MAG: outer membrane beta-barrel protein [Alphaproteobacteria bacterium]
MKILFPSILAVGLLGTQMAHAFPGDRYIGFTVGQAWTTQDVDAKHNNTSYDLSGNEWNFGAVAGIAWNGTKGSYIGVEGELEVGFDHADTVGFNGDNRSFSAGIYGRAGWWFGNAVLLYGKAGVKQNYIDYDFGKNSSYSSIETGLGAEYILNESWTLRAEYAYEWATDNNDVFKDYTVKRSKNNVSIGIMRHF